MTTLADEFLVACEVHSPTRLRAVSDAGFDVRAPVNGTNPVATLVALPRCANPHSRTNTTTVRPGR